MKNLAAVALIIVFSVVSAFPQKSLESLSKAIEAEPNNAENYMKRYEFYKDIWEENQNDLESAALGLVDLSKYISLKPNDEEAYRIRAAVREAFYLGANPYSIADYKKSLQISPNENPAKERLAAMEAQYKTMYASKECVNYRSKKGFQGDGNEPMTILSESMSDLDDSFDPQDGLKAVACGADVNYFYKKDDRRPEFDDIIRLNTIHLVAMLEAGGRTENKNKFGETVLLMTLQRYLVETGYISDKENFIKKLKILFQYGANVNVKNLKGQTALSLARKTKNKEVIALLENQMAQNYVGEWSYGEDRFGLAITIKAENGKLTGDYGNFSSKTSEGNILSSNVNGNTATIEIDCDWGGKGTVQLTLLKGNKLHWKVIKRDESKGDFIVLLDQILTKK